jgi:hypothetical protein
MHYLSFGVSVALLCICVLAAVSDLVLVLVYGREFTITQVLRTWARDYPLVPFFFGVLMGHLFG